MNLSGNTVLVTGGASGIGLALAKRWVAAGSKVVLCGRRQEQLEKAKKECPSLSIIQCDLASEVDRNSLFSQIVHEFPQLNILVNNAGIQNRPPALTEPQKWDVYKQEIATNFEAPIHLSLLFIPHLVKQASAAIVNVSSGLAFSPLSFMPTYCATKAALHSFTLSLRHQLKATSIQVVEVIPPAVNTDLGGKGLHNDGVPLAQFADHVMMSMAKGELEFGFGFSENARVASREQLDTLFRSMNK
jgi:uncharacterized oxidoreductase